MWLVEIIPVNEKSKLGMNPVGWNNPCGTEKPDRDASDWSQVIPVEQKSKIEMHPAGRNNPCGAKEQERDADQFKFAELTMWKKVIERNGYDFNL